VVALVEFDIVLLVLLVTVSFNIDTSPGGNLNCENAICRISAADTKISPTDMIKKDILNLFLIELN
jgi:hypothetical protein